MRNSRLAVTAALVLVLAALAPSPQVPLVLDAQVQPARGVRYAQIRQTDLTEWLTYLSSDDLQGRQTFSEGFGLASEYVADHLKAFGVKPLGDKGSYFQPVRLKSYRVDRRSSVTVEINGQSRTFKHGDHVTFPAASGGKQTIVFDSVEFVGYGLVNASQQYDDFKGRDLKGRLVVSVAGTPAGFTGGGARGRGGRAYAVGTAGAKAAIDYATAPAAPTPAQDALTKAQTAIAEAGAAVSAAQQAQRGAVPPPGGRGGGARAGGAPATGADLTTVLNVEALAAPQITADDVFYEFLFSAAPTKFADLKARAAKGDALPGFSLTGVKVTFNIDNAYEVISSQLTKNVVGLIEGSDPKLKDTYVMFGAHLDHVGYSQLVGRGAAGGGGGCRRRSPDSLAALTASGKTPQSVAGRGRGTTADAAPVLPVDQRDVVYNGADDDGSGSAVVLAIAKAFATGPKPRRSVIVIWHTDEEGGLLGSRYNADFPVVPIEKVQTVLNIDMVGRDDCNNLEGDYTNSLFVIGADRISTDLHNIIVETNRTMTPPLALDYEMNDVSDPESLYTRSDHYSYASKGIPIAFFTTGLHPDYHRVSDSVEKIVFPKMTRIAQLIYETGFSIANSDRLLERDNKGARTGLGSKMEVITK